MSDVAVAPATSTPAPAVSAPVASEAPVATEAAEVRAEPTNAREHRQAMRDRARGVVNPALEVNRRHEQPRAPDGKFTSPVATEVAGLETTGAVAATTPETVAPTAPVAAEPPAFVSIQLPEGHPLRAEGLTELSVRPDQERAARALVNSHTRRQEVEQTRQELYAERRARLEAEARAQVLLEQRSSALKNPEIAAKYAEIANAWGPEEADRYLRGYENEWTEQITAKEREAQEAFEAQRQEQDLREQGHQFATNVFALAKQANIADWWLQENLRGTLGGYGYELSVLQQSHDPAHQQRARQMADPQVALAHLLRAYTEDPRVKPYIERHRMEQAQQHVQSLKQQIEAEAEAKRNRELQQIADRAKTNPMGRIPTAAGTGQQGMPVQVGPQNAREAREQARRRRYDVMTG